MIGAVTCEGGVVGELSGGGPARGEGDLTARIGGVGGVVVAHGVEVVIDRDVLSWEGRCAIREGGGEGDGLVDGWGGVGDGEGELGGCLGGRRGWRGGWRGISGGDGDGGGKAIHGLVRWADVVERDDGRSLLDALKSKNLRSGRADKIMRVRIADRPAVRKRQRCAIELRFPLVARRRIRL